MPSTVTVTIACKVSHEVKAALERRAAARGKPLSAYLRDRLTYDTLRKHGRRVKQS